MKLLEKLSYPLLGLGILSQSYGMDIELPSVQWGAQQPSHRIETTEFTPKISEYDIENNTYTKLLRSNIYNNGQPMDRPLFDSLCDTLLKQHFPPETTKQIRDSPQDGT